MVKGSTPSQCGCRLVVEPVNSRNPQDSGTRVTALARDLGPNGGGQKYLGQTTEHGSLTRVRVRLEKLVTPGYAT